jgi:hypothetical protein
MPARQSKRRAGAAARSQCVPGARFGDARSERVEREPDGSLLRANGRTRPHGRPVA